MQTFKMFLEAAVVKYKSAVVIDNQADFAKIQKIIDADYSDAMSAFLKNGKGIWRGMRLNDGEFAVFAQPSTGKRRSENTYNFYTLFIDENPEWAEYPKRSNSFICSTDLDRAQSYGRLRDKRTCLILPKNGSKIGVVPADDIWNVEEVPFLNRELESIQEFAELAAYWTNTTYSHLRDTSIKSMSQLKKAIHPKMLDDLVKEATAGDTKLQNQLKDARGLYYDVDKVFAYVEKQWSPEKLGFELKSTNEISSIKPEREVWTDGDCLVLEENFVSQLLDYEQGKKDDEEANV